MILRRINKLIEVDGTWVEAWPDNDGGLWYYDPETGEVKHID